MVGRPIGAGIVVLLAAWLASGQALGAPDARTEKAREHYLQGDANYKLDKYANALAEYEQAYLAKPDPSFLYNIAQCHRLMGDRTEAVRFYRRYLKDAPNAPNREVAEKHIKDLEAALASPEEATHGKPPAPTSAPSPTPVPKVAPAPTTTATAPMPPPQPSVPPPTLALNVPPGFSDAPSGGSAGAPVAPSSDESHPIYTKWWFWTGVGVVVVGGLLIALAASSHDPSCPSGRMCQ